MEKEAIMLSEIMNHDGASGNSMEHMHAFSRRSTTNKDRTWLRGRKRNVPVRTPKMTTGY
jgi:hypothetical protein